MSTSSNPMQSIFKAFNALYASSLHISSLPIKFAKSRTLLNNRLAIRGVPRLLIAIKFAASSSILVLKTFAVLLTICSISSTL